MIGHGVIVPLILAASTVADPLGQLGVQPAPRNLLGMRLTDILLIMAVTLLLATALILWAIFLRRPKDDPAHPRVYKSRPYAEERDDGTIRKRKKHKRLRRHHRTRNPTLAEAGGLPPMKSDSTPPPI
jgi:hypothetical protein